MKKKGHTCGHISGHIYGHTRDTNNNDNNIYNLNLINNNNIRENSQEDFIGFIEGDEVSTFLKTKGICSLKEYKKLNKKKQDDLIEEWFLKNR